jgi:hypothetical protein
VLAELALAVFTSRTLQEDMERFLRLACRLTPGCATGSISVLVDGRPTTTAVSDHLAFELDIAQYDAGDGPCLRALGGQTVRLLARGRRF